MFGWGKNRENGKYGGKWHFLLFGWGEKIRETKNMGEYFPSGPTFFYLPNLDEKWGGKNVERCTLHKYSRFKLHFFFLSSLFPRQHIALFLPFFFFFFWLGNNVTSNVASFFLLFFFFLSFSGQSRCLLLLFFFLGH